jgi:transposase
VIEECGARLHLAHPLGIKAFAYQRVKKDESDARLLADLLRMGRLPEAWIAPPATRELRELVRYRHKVVEARANAKAQVHAVLAKQGVRVPMSDLFGVGGTKLLNDLALDDVYLIRVESLRDLIALHGREIAMLDRAIAARLEGDKGYEAIQAIPGVGKVLAAIFVAEIGDVSRFARPEQLASWAGMTPRHHESDTTVRRGHITKMACGRTGLTGPSAKPSGGDRDHLGRPRRPSSAADLRLPRRRHRRGAHRQDRSCEPRSAACLAAAVPRA